MGLTEIITEKYEVINVPVKSGEYENILNNLDSGLKPYASRIVLKVEADNLVKNLYKYDVPGVKDRLGGYSTATLFLYDFVGFVDNGSAKVELNYLWGSHEDVQPLRDIITEAGFKPVAEQKPEKEAKKAEKEVKKKVKEEESAPKYELDESP